MNRNNDSTSKRTSDSSKNTGTTNKGKGGLRGGNKNGGSKDNK